MKVTLIKKQPEVGDIMTFWLEPERPVEWQAGQYAEYKLALAETDEEGDERYFTIAAAPYEGHLQITTRMRDTAFKRALKDLPEGDGFEMKEIDGDFVVADASQQYVFLAGGIGVTPYRAILLDMAHKGQSMNITLLYANRNQDIAFRDELEQLAASHPEFKVEFLVEPQRLDEQTIKQYVSDLQVPVFYVSGPVPMVKAVADMLKGMGIAEGKIKLDDFPGYESI